MSFWKKKKKLYMFRTVPLSITRIRNELQFRPDPARKLSTNMYDK